MPNLTPEATSMIKKFWVPSYLLGTLKEATAKVDRSLAKSGLSVGLVIGETRLANVAPWNHKTPIMQEQTEVSILYPHLQIEGWTLLAKIEAFGGDTLVSANPIIEKPFDSHGRTFDLCHCDHCGQRRVRKVAYLLAREDKEIQVGGTCLRMFFGVDPTGILNAFEAAMMLVQNYGSEDSDGYRDARQKYHCLATFASITAKVIREKGWVTRGKALPGQQATADRAYTDAFPSGNYIPTKPTQEDSEIATQAIAWACNLDAESDYERNIRLLAREGAIPFGKEGLAASIVGVYLSQKASRAESAQIRKSTHIGQVGKRENLGTFKVVSTRFFESFFGRQVSVKTLVRLVNDAGQIVIWWASSAITLEEGVQVNVKATVKAHDEYNGTPQTVITRAIISPIYS